MASHHLLHPDQAPSRWNQHIDLYQSVFEPLTDQFAGAALAAMKPAAGDRLLDCAAGTGGAAILAARAGAKVAAIDAASAMVTRIASRAEAAGLSISTACMDAQALDFPDDCFELSLSILGIILCPDPIAALRELARVTRPGGRIALVTWTEPESYELAARLRRAATGLSGLNHSSPSLPPQLRYRTREAFADLFAAAGLKAVSIERLAGHLVAPSPRWLADRLGFAPGLADMLGSFGADRDAILDRFVSDLCEVQGNGIVKLSAVALLGIAELDPRRS